MISVLEDFSQFNRIKIQNGLSVDFKQQHVPHVILECRLKRMLRECLNISTTVWNFQKQYKYYPSDNPNDCLERIIQITEKMGVEKLNIALEIIETDVLACLKFITNRH